MKRPLYAHPWFYELLHDGRSHDLPHYESKARRFGRALDVGAGTGRVALHLARQGCDVVALEREASMLARLEARLALEPSEIRQRVLAAHGALSDYPVTEPFGLVFVAHNGLAHQRDDSELGPFLAAVRRQLLPEGLFCFDVPIPNPKLLAGHVGYIPWFRDPRTGNATRSTEHVSYESERQLLSFAIQLVELEGAGETLELSLELRQFFPEQIPGLLARHGFVVEEQKTLGDETFYTCRAR